MVSYKIIGKHIKEARTRLGLKQFEAAELSGLSTTYYGKIERGFIKPNIDRLGDISSALQIPLESLFLGACVKDAEKTENTPASAEEFETFMREIGESAGIKTKLILMRICETVVSELTNETDADTDTHK